MPIFNEAIECVKYNNGPWASTGSDSCVDVAGYWHFPSPDVSNKDEVKPPIRIVSLKQGFLVVPNVFEGYADDDLAFTDAVDAAEWLLGWLGLDAKIVSAGDIRGGLSECEEPAALDFRWDLDAAKGALDVVRAAQAYVTEFEAGHDGSSGAHQRLVEAVKKWRGIDSEESAKADTST